MVPLASSMFAPGIPQVLSDFDTNNPSLATFVVSVYILGLAAYVYPHLVPKLSGPY